MAYFFRLAACLIAYALESIFSEGINKLVGPLTLCFAILSITCMQQFFTEVSQEKRDLHRAWLDSTLANEEGEKKLAAVV